MLTDLAKLMQLENRLLLHVLKLLLCTTLCEKSIFLIKKFMPKKCLFEGKNCDFHCLLLEKMLHARMHESRTDLKREKNTFCEFRKHNVQSYLGSANKAKNVDQRQIHE